VTAIQGLWDPTDFGLYGPGVVAGLAIALVCSILSPIVVLKRLSFVGQGISHAAFGGIGIAAILGTLDAFVGMGSTFQFVVVLGFCLAAALVIAWLIDRGADQADTAIGIVLVASMTLGAILIQWSFEVRSQAAWRAAHEGAGFQVQSWESILFGSIFAVDWAAAAIAWAVALGILGTLWWFRRPMMFWAFDEPAARAFGVPTTAMKYLLIVLLTFAIVTAMKLAGVILATAMLVLPAAAALRLSSRSTPILLLAVTCGLFGVVGGLALAFKSGFLPPGACIVAVLVVSFGVASLAAGVQSRRSAQ
jgi:ABC-type Mn2+/Zn2+ transport system permease subunit